MEIQKLLCFVLIVIMMNACETNNDNNAQFANSGLASSITDNDSTEVYKKSVDTLNSKKPITIIAEVNHSENATKAQISLSHTRTILFGNPKLGTPIMQKNPQAGLDLPQKIVVYSHDKGSVVLYNSTDYLEKRHGVQGVASLAKIKQALSNMVKSITGKTPQETSADIKLNEGVITKQSKHDVATTYAKIKNIIEKNPNLSVMAELDHQANAARVNLELSPCRIIVFGNPKLGSPLMEESRSTAIDLPQKMLVYQNKDGQTIIAYNDPNYLGKRHSIVKNEDILEKIAKALNKISENAAN